MLFISWKKKEVCFVSERSVKAFFFFLMFFIAKLGNNICGENRDLQNVLPTEIICQGKMLFSRERDNPFNSHY